VASCPGAAFGISLLAADAWRRDDVQPLVDAFSRVAVVADCRLDNRKALRSELRLGADVTDSALLLEGYHRWGDALCGRLRGDFACVIWDWGNRRCLAFRDPLGVKPLFYARSAGRLIIASDTELILELVQPNPQLDDQAVVEYLLWEYSSPRRTFFSAITRLPGGHLLVDDSSGRCSIQRYWKPATKPERFEGVGEVYGEFRRLFFTSVERRLDSDGPVLAHLSGGLDSSLIVCIADRIRRQKGGSASWFGTVSERFPGTSWDEGEFIQAVTNLTGIEGLAWDGGKADFVDLLSPSLSGPGMGAYRTSGSLGDTELATQKGARVVISGEGGDQLGAPYGANDDLASLHPLSFALETFRRSDLSLAARLTRARGLLRQYTPMRLRLALATFRYKRRMPSWLQPRWRSLAGDIVSTFYQSGFEASFELNVQRAHWHQLTSTRMGTALDMQQRIGGKSGVEFRFPFLDQDLVDFVLSIPCQYWPVEMPGSRLHRDALGYFLPSTIRERRTKAIFSGAVGQRLRRAAAQLDALFHGGEWLSGRYVLRKEAQILLRRALAGERWQERWRDWHEVRAIATVEAWLRAIFGYHEGRGKAAEK
jgi:asparagine synthase (glutamine-hydrolysing)